MAASVEVVEYYFDYVVIFEDLRVCGVTVDDRVRGGFSDAQGCVQSGHFWFDVGLVVDRESDSLS